VNLSVHDLVDRDVAAEFAEAFVRYGANPKDITAELTESGAVENPARVRHVLDELKAMGMGTAIDDYGTGFSSLASLADLPFDELKIDQLFVRQMVDSPSYESIVRSTVRMAHELGLKVVAEGAETARTVSALATIDCDKVQGYAVSQPVPADDLLLLVSRFAWRSWEPTQQVAELHRRRFA
jgi:EAL domain-containing protein (putative c-di-GMP-specific phosphodiesterase class I)